MAVAGDEPITARPFREGLRFVTKGRAETVLGETVASPSLTVELYKSKRLGCKEELLIAIVLSRSWLHHSYTKEEYIIESKTEGYVLGFRS